MLKVLLSPSSFIIVIVQLIYDMNAEKWQTDVTVKQNRYKRTNRPKLKAQPMEERKRRR